MSSPPLRIAICGLGAAGRARERAFPEVSGVQLVALVSRRLEFRTRRFEEVLADSQIDAVAVSTENTQHASMVRSALEMNKHVLCDYPLALSGTEAGALFALAKEKNRVLHVEHIGLLSEEHQRLKIEADRAGPLASGEYIFQGGWNEKLANPDYAGPCPFVAVSRLLQIADCFGSFEIESHRLEQDTQGFLLHLHLRFPEDGRLGFTEERRIGLPRRRSLLAECARGTLALKTATMTGGLFAKDLAWFRDRVLEGKACYYNEAQLLRILEQLEKL